MPRRLKFSLLSATFLVVALSGCGTPSPDYRIRVMSSADERTVVAVPPECPNWREYGNTPNENHYGVQFGCASARNLAAQVANKDDLIKGAPLGGSDGTYTAATINNYRAAKTKPLIHAWSEAPTASQATGAGTTP